jgi:hypothetical protein
MSDLGFWIPVLGIPLLAVFANVVLRVFKGLPQSALSDIILCFVVFDALVVIQHTEFQEFIRVPMIKEAIIPFYEFIFFLNVFLWFLAVTELERRIVSYYESSEKTLYLYGVCWQIVSIVLAIMVVFESIAPFAYRMA